MRIVWLQLGVLKIFIGLSLINYCCSPGQVISCFNLFVSFVGYAYEYVVVYSTFESELADVIPVVKTSIGGTRIIGRLCAGEFYLY